MTILVYYSRKNTRKNNTSARAVQTSPEARPRRGLPEALQGFSKSSPEALQNRPELSDRSRALQIHPELARALQTLPEAPRACQSLPEALQTRPSCSPEPSRPLQSLYRKVPELARACQRPSRSAPQALQFPPTASPATASQRTPEFPEEFCLQIYKDRILSLVDFLKIVARVGIETQCYRYNVIMCGFT